MKNIGVAIIGGTGYGAGELLRLLTQHPQVEVVTVVSASVPGVPVAAAHPHLTGFYSLSFDASLNVAALEQFEQRVIFLALPHGAAHAAVEALLPEVRRLNALLIDLSGDFRLQDAAIRRRFYPEAAVTDELQQQFVYGLTELNREQIRSARMMSTPGCLATAAILGAAPLLQAPYSGSVVFDLKTGTSGAGKGLSDSFHHPTRDGNSTPYKVLQHRHEPEVLQALGDPFGERIRSSFVPHLVPTSRGCSATIYFELPESSSTDALLNRYRAFYQDSPFIRIRTQPPEWQTVVGTNFCDISVVARGTTVVVMAALDNLVKGTAGQAIQNMNLAASLPEHTGLWFPARGPSTPVG